MDILLYISDNIEKGGYIMKLSLLSAIVMFLVAITAAFSSKAFEQTKSDPKPDWSKLQIVTYASGLTGFFDPDSGKLYIYDANWDRCFCIRQLTQLGDSMKKVRN